MLVLGLSKNKYHSVKSTLIAPLAVFISAYIVGGWVGMGIVVISFGMLAVVLFVLLIHFLIENKTAKS
ncbi:hypothetical protein K0H71_21860 [Bacillus sp. IITD106]|nr:hypothetical protein [Bacillus sp. IITD106]